MLQIRFKNYELGRNSLDFRGPIIWNSLDRGTRNIKDLNSFKRVIKKNKKTIDQVTFIRGTCFNNNKDDSYVYY
jgi:hypothetical protein